jgi:putative DNA primase/helicase
MPLRPISKVPALNNWAIYAVQMPSPEEQERWLDGYPDGNIGLPLGPQSGIIALDLDSVDPRVEAMLLEQMPKVLWKRVGKKGAVFAFKYNGERTYRIKDEHNNTIFELLSKGAQVVLPPSIHPDTMAPYTANCDLLDVVDQLPQLPTDFETKARQALLDMGFKLTGRGATKITEWVPAGGRDSAMVTHAGLLARAVLRGERTLMEAMNEIELWVMTYTAKVDGDLLDPKKARQKVMEFVRRDITESAKILPPNWAVGLTPDDKLECQKFFGDEVEEWTRVQLLDYLTDQFAIVPREDMPGRKDLIDEALIRISKSPNMSTLDTEMVLSFIQAASGRMIAIGALRKRLNELSAGDFPGTDHTSIAQALVKELERDGELRFQGTYFYRWGGSHWVVVEEHIILSTLAREFGHLPAAKKFSDHKGITQVMAKLCAKSLADIDASGINFANGFLTLDLELLDHDPRYGMTYVMPYRYLAGYRPPTTFMSLLDQSWGQDDDYLDKVQALREAFAASMFGLAHRFGRAVCLQGLAHSGKTVIMDVMRGMIPTDAACSVPPADWGDKFLPTQMFGKLINFCGEMSETQLIPGAQFKGMVEGGEISGQLKGGQIFRFKPTCAQWFASNHLPRSRDTSSGFTRRWLFLKFNRACKSEDKRVDFAKEILAEDQEAIVAWAAPAIKDLWERQDFTLPPSHLEMVADVASLNNSVRNFLRTGPVRRGPGLRCPEPELYSLYFAFCKAGAMSQPVSQPRFWAMMEDLMAEFDLVRRDPGPAESNPVPYVAGIGRRR